MRLLPRFKRRAPIEEEISTRKAALREKRARRHKSSRRRIATPLARLAPNEIPPDAIVFQRPAPEPIAEEPVQGPAQQAAPATLEDAGPDPLDTPPDFLLKDQSFAEPSSNDASPEAVLAGDTAFLAEEPERKPEDSGLGGDMLDLFREEKAASSDGSLASEVEDIPISDLLKDISSITEQLGVPKRDPYLHEVHIEPEPPGDEPAPEPEPEIRIEKVVTRPVAVATEPMPEAVAEVEEEIDLGSLLEPTPEEAPQTPREEPAEAPRPAPRPAPRRVDPGMMLHMLLLMIVLGAAGAFGATRISRPGSAGAEEDGGTHIVLAVVTTPRATVAPIGTKAPTPSPSPLVTPSPTPAPSRRARDASIPAAYHDYKVEYGDTLTSIALGFGLCPDHLLWANNRDEDTPLIAGEYLTIPDGPGVVHRVKNGDTLSSIAIMYNADVAAITAVQGNQLSTSADLIPGTEIFIPDGIPQSALDLGSRAYKKMTKPSSAGYVWPFFGTITTYYGEERVGYIHNAIDVGGLGHFGASVNAIADGRVAFVGHDDLYGNNVIVLHPDGTRSRYAHFSKVYVSQGESVSRGQALGALGCSGDSTGTHLHFELWKGDEPVDPLAYLP
jgi:LysM repeat protein